MNNVCRSDRTVAENEIINLRDFFKKGCRPGPWVPQSPGVSDNNELSKTTLCVMNERDGIVSFFFLGNILIGSHISI